jgi:hypothetical protein
MKRCCTSDRHAGTDDAALHRSCSVLLRAQSDNRIDLRGAQRRNVAGEDCHSEQRLLLWAPLFGVQRIHTLDGKDGGMKRIWKPGNQETRKGSIDARGGEEGNN